MRNNDSAPFGAESQGEGPPHVEPRGAGAIDPAPAPPQPSIVASYDYRDEEEAVLFQVVRLEPKDFRQRRPDPDVAGGCIWDLEGVTLVPYRLPELLAADPAETVWVPEGEKHCDRLAAQGLVASTSPM